MYRAFLVMNLKNRPETSKVGQWSFFFIKEKPMNVWRLFSSLIDAMCRLNPDFRLTPAGVRLSILNTSVSFVFPPQFQAMLRNQ